MSKSLLRLLALFVVGLGLPSFANGQVIITEIFYNLSGAETGSTEWVEIANTGDTDVDMTGWVFGDSQDQSFNAPFPAGTILPARSAAVLTFQDPANFEQIWGPGINVIPLENAISWSNSPSPTNETVALFTTAFDPANPAANLVDEVNYDDGNGTDEFFPLNISGSSIYLRPEFLTATDNDSGLNWGNSMIGVDGAYEALALNPDITGVTILDIASPGFVEGLVPQFLLGDANGDGTVDNGDINAFLQALLDPAGYAVSFPGIDVDVVLDLNGDETFNNLDINGFLALLGL